MVMGDLDIDQHADGSTVIAVNGRTLYLSQQHTDELVARLAKPRIVQEVARLTGLER